MIFPSNSNRDFFYSNSSATVEKGDHIRFQDIRLAYQFHGKPEQPVFRNLQLYCYINNIGVLWKAAKSRIDPVTNGYLPLPRTYSFGLSTNF